MGLLLFYAALSIIFSFLCSVWEAVLLSIPPSYVEIESQKETAKGIALKEMKSEIDRPLSAILTMNTIAHTVGAMGVGAVAAKLYKDGDAWFTIPYIDMEIGAEAFIAVMMTLAILLLSEIIPKTIGASYWRSLTGFTVTSLKFIMFILAPLVWLSQKITKLLKTPGHGSVLSRQDFAAMADIGAKEGVIQKNESKIINNLLTFNTVKAEDIMTPRTVVQAADESRSINDYYESITNFRFSRIPVFKGNKDSIHGFVLKDEILENIIRKNGDSTLGSIKREIMIVNKLISLPDLFNKLMEKREHIALVVDEFGGMAGIVTMEDVIETLLGMEIVDELDGIADMQVLARKNWEKRAKILGIIDEEFNELKEVIKKDL